MPCWVMLVTLTVWQKKRVGHPTRAGEGRLEDPTVEMFDAAITKLLSMVEPESTAFQIVARVGDSSRAFQLGENWNEVLVKAELWDQYRSLAGVNG